MAGLLWLGLALSGYPGMISSRETEGSPHDRQPRHAHDAVPPPRPGPRHDPARDGGDAPARAARGGDVGEVMAGLASVIGLLHPGEMGSAVGATLVSGGSRVLWASEGRGARTRQRAEEIGLEDAGTLPRRPPPAGGILSGGPAPPGGDGGRRGPP